jgi:hypothetical protein
MQNVLACAWGDLTMSSCNNSAKACDKLTATASYCALFRGRPLGDGDPRLAALRSRDIS